MATVGDEQEGATIVIVTEVKLNTSRAPAAGIALCVAKMIFLRWVGIRSLAPDDLSPLPALRQNAFSGAVRHLLPTYDVMWRARREDMREQRRQEAKLAEYPTT